MTDINIQNLALIFTVTVGVLYFFIHDYFGYKSSKAKEEEAKKSFDSTINRLSSEDNVSKLSAAIMLRRFMKPNCKEYQTLCHESINVISSMLKIQPSGVFQKTLADGLAYSNDLSNADLQKTNLQDCYFGKKGMSPILIENTDFFLADLSYALVENVKGKAVFYHSILFCTQIKNCDLSGSDFREADLSGTSFKNVILKDANFSNAINIPQAIKSKLKDGICTEEQAINAKEPTKGKTIFFSMPSTMKKEEELIAKDFKLFLEEEGYDVIYYKKDDYPCFGQLNKVKEKIKDSVGMIAFGFEQLHIKEATYRPQTKDERIWKDFWQSTPWSEIEVGMGIMKSMPILIVKSPNINHGIFDNKLSECFIVTLATTTDSRNLSQNKDIAEWLSKINAL